MRQFARVLGLFAIALVLVHSGCIQAEESATLMPDGSGKLLMKIGFKKSMIAMLEGLSKAGGGDGATPDPFDQFKDPAKLVKNGEGIAAWGDLKKEEDADWVRISVTGYFEDINKVKLYGEQDQPGGEKKKTLSFAGKYERLGEGGRLTMASEMTDDFRKMGKDAPGADGNEELAKAMLDIIKPMLEGLKITVAVTVPGPVEDTGGLGEKNGRTASVTIEGNTVLDAIKDPKGPAAKKLEALSKAGERGNVITWSKTTVKEDEVAAFRKEMSAAKESWAKRLKETDLKKPGEKKDEKNKKDRDF